MDKHIVFGVHITERIRHAGDVQKVLTDHGCLIRTRIGLHEVSQGVCAPNGLIVLELLDDEAKASELKSALEAIDGVEVQSMVFDHP